MFLKPIPVRKRAVFAFNFNGDKNKKLRYNYQAAKSQNEHQNDLKALQINNLGMHSLLSLKFEGFQPLF